MMNLVGHRPTLWDTVVQVGGTQAVLALAVSGHPSAQAHAANELSRLAADPDRLQELLLAPDLFDVLLALLTSPVRQVPFQVRLPLSVRASGRAAPFDAGAACHRESQPPRAELAPLARLRARHEGPPGSSRLRYLNNDSRRDVCLSCHRAALGADRGGGNDREPQLQRGESAHAGALQRAAGPARPHLRLERRPAEHR